MKEYLLPKKIISVDGIVKNIECLFEKKEMQIGLSEKDFVEMQETSSILLDYGKEICGGIRLLIYNFTNLPVKLRIRFGESISETLSNIGDKNSTNDHALRDYEITTTNLCDIETGQTGFRFVKIDKITSHPILRIKNIYGVSYYTDKKLIGKFNSSNKLINTIYDVANRTVSLCIQNQYIWDGIKRDRLVWIGDLYPEFISLSCLYNDLSEVKNSLMFVKNQTPVTSWMNHIPMYSMWWLIILHDYYIKTNDFDLLESNVDYIVGITNQILDNITDDGNTVFKSNFFDWPTSNTDDEIVGVHALTIFCLKKTYNLFKYLKIESNHIKFKLNSLLNKNINAKSKKQVKAFLAIAKNEFDSSVSHFLSEDNSHGFSTFMSYFILKALFESGEKQKSIDLMIEYYNGMLKMGATTFFEDFDISWIESTYGIDSLSRENKKDIHGDFGRDCYVGFRHSLCHGWSAGVIAFIVEEIVGIKLLEPGCKSILIQPFLGNLEYINYKYPTPYGSIELKIYRKENNIVVKLNKPKEINVIVKDATLE